MTFNVKKEILLFSNIEIPMFMFSLNGVEIPIKNHHKHIGITITSDAKWSMHIENIIASTKKHLNILRKLKFQLNRNILEKLYLSYIRPLLELLELYCFTHWKIREILLPYYRLSVTRESFFLATIKEWKNLDITIRKIDSVSKVGFNSEKFFFIRA